MAKIQELYDRNTEEAIYPRTSTQAVYDAEGRDIETRLAAEAAKTDEKLAQYTKTDALTEQLAGKQDALTVSDDLELSGENVLSVTERAKRAAFIDMWNAESSALHRFDAGYPISGKYDPENAPDSMHPFWCNKLWLTYEEAIDAFNSRLTRRTVLTGALRHAVCRTAMCCVHFMYGESVDCTDVCSSATRLEEIVLSNNANQGIWVAEMRYAFFGCNALREILPHIHDSVSQANGWNMSFGYCYNLEEVRISELSHSLNFSWSHALSLASLQHLVTNAANGTTAITVTVHVDVFAKLTGDTTNEAAAALTGEELAQWAQVLTDALEKNITFATV